MFAYLNEYAHLEEARLLFEVLRLVRELKL
jgi:hypothetical protein